MEYGRLDNKIYFFTIIILVIIIIIGFLKKKNILKQIGIKRTYLTGINNIILIIGLSLVLFSLLEPRKEIGKEKIEKKGSDIYFLIDISKSMLTEDMTPSRLSRAKESIKEIIDKLNGDRVGFIPFSSQSYVQMPLTDDYTMAENFLEMIDPTLIAGGGTNIRQAIMLANESLKKQAGNSKFIVILSDGEELENKMDIKGSLDQNVKIFTLGYGTISGGPVKDIDENGTISGIKLDENGNSIISKLDEKSLKDLAIIGNGEYYPAEYNGSEVFKMVDSILKSKKESKGEVEIKIYKQYYQYFLGAGVILILLGQLIAFKRKEKAV